MMSHDKPVDFSAVPPRVAPPVFLIEYHSCSRGGKKKVILQRGTMYGISINRERSTSVTVYPWLHFLSKFSFCPTERPGRRVII